MVALRQAGGSLRFDIHLQGPLETPFLTFPGQT
jgi:protocatechuate 3,4-dioxygenase, alpha subunit